MGFLFPKALAMARGWGWCAVGPVGPRRRGRRRGLLLCTERGSEGRNLQFAHALDDDREFQDVVTDLWAESDDLDDFSRRLDVLGDRILEAKRAYLERRKPDDRLFGNRFTPEV